MIASEAANLTREEIKTQVQALGRWFHNIDLKGVKTAPDHFLGDYPSVKFDAFKHAIPADLTGKSVLDIGCNGGFYSIEMKKRGADRVVGIDSDEDYLKQARFAARVNEIRYRVSANERLRSTSAQGEIRRRHLHGCVVSPASSAACA